MNFEAYRDAYFTDPVPTPRFRFANSCSVTLAYQNYAVALDYYREVLGEPAYVEGEGTHGWPIGSGWLTLVQGDSGDPKNVEITLEMATPEEAEQLQSAFVHAGGQGEPPSDALMYEPIRYCPVRDPLGVAWLITSPL